MLPVAVARSSSDGNAIAICHVSLLPVFWMTSCFHVMERMGRTRDDGYVSSSGGTGGEVCRIRLSLIGAVALTAVLSHLIQR